MVDQPVVTPNFSTPRMRTFGAISVRTIYAAFRAGANVYCIAWFERSPPGADSGREPNFVALSSVRLDLLFNPREKIAAYYTAVGHGKADKTRDPVCLASSRAPRPAILHHCEHRHLFAFVHIQVPGQSASNCRQSVGGSPAIHRGCLAQRLALWPRIASGTHPAPGLQRAHRQDTSRSHAAQCGGTDC